MKKSIIYLGFALVVFSNVAMAAVPGTSLMPVVAIGYTAATPLAIAISKGDITSVKKFIEYGSDIDEKSNDMTPLMLAARYNQVEIINLLLQNGANAKATNTKGYTALKYAELSNAAQAVTALTQVK